MDHNWHWPPVTINDARSANDHLMTAAGRMTREAQMTTNDAKQQKKAVPNDTASKYYVKIL